VRRIGPVRFSGLIAAAMATLGIVFAVPTAACASTLIENVSVLPMTGAGLQANWAVLVDGDRIVAAGPRESLAAPADATVVDGAGGVLLPGLIDMHIHLDHEHDGRQSDVQLGLLAAHGVTTARVMWGHDGQLALRRAILAENRFAPSLVLAGPGFSKSAMSPAEVKAEVERQAKEGWDLIKVHWKPTLAQYDAIISAAKSVGKEVDGHVPYAVSLDHVLASGQRSIEHMDGYIRDIGAEGGAAPQAALEGAVARSKAAGVAVAPTLFGWRVHLHHTSVDELNALPGLAFVPAATLADWRARYERPLKEQAKDWIKLLIGRRDVDAIVANRNRLLKAFSDGGVPVLFGTDSGQPFVVAGATVPAEMAEMRAAGLTNRQIIESATVTAGRFLDSSGCLGVIAPGARADILVLPSDPTTDLQAFARPLGVMLRGKWHSGEEISRFLADARAAAGR
jgi:hypothetical protein